MVQSAIAKGELPLGLSRDVVTSDIGSPRLASTCPDGVAIQREPAASTARLQCLARLTAIELDGVTLTVPLETSTDPQTGQAGLLVMLPVAALSSGRHEVSLNHPDSRARSRYRIPFWK